MNLVIIVAVIAAVAGLAVTHSGVPASAMRLLTGDAWLENASAGTVSHVNGYSGGTDAQATVGKAGDPFEVVQREGGAFVLDLRTGRLSRLADGGLNVTTAVTGPTPARALQVITAPKATWILDKSSGVLQQVNPTTLKPLGQQVALGGRTGAGVVDSSGSIWVPLLSKAGVDQVNPGGALSHHAFGRAGDAIELADTSGGVWAVDAHAKTVASLSTPTAHTVSLPALAKAPIVGASASSPDLVLVSGTQVLNVDTTQPSLSSLALPAAAASVTQVAVSSGSSGASDQAYLLDPQTHRLDTINLFPMGLAGSTPVPAGADQLVAKDQLVFVNSTSSPQALVVNPDGAVTNVTKYTPHVPPQPDNQGQAIVPTTNSTPSSTAPSPTSPPQTTSPATAPGEGTSPPASVTSPPAPSFTGPPPTAQTSATPALTTPAPTAPVPTAPAPTAPPTTAAPPTTPAPPTTAAPTVPGAPTAVNATAGNGQVTVTWTAPASDGGSPLTGYKVTGQPTNPPNGGTVTAPPYTITGLGAGVNECVQIQAVNAKGGSPFSGQVCATTPAPPGAVSNLSITAADKQLIVNWGAASGATSYQVTVAGKTNTTANTSLTAPVPAWTPETVQVKAVNSVGAGPVASQSSAAWTRTGTSTCEDSLSGDQAVENDCTNVVQGGAWTVHPSTITWINPSGQLGNLHGNFEWLCSTYYVLTVGKLSSDVYAVENNAPSQAACTTALPGYQAPDTPHVIAAVSTTPLPGGQHICEYQGTTTGTDRNFITQELTICGSGVPSGLSGASEVANFYT